MIVTNGYGSLSIVTNGYGRRDSLYGYVVPVVVEDNVEDVPVTVYVSEAIPSRGTSSDGAWTEVDQGGAWTEPPLNGAYTQDNSYLDEVKPMNFFTKDDVPAYASVGSDSVPVFTPDAEPVPGGTLPAGRGAYTTVGTRGAKTTIGRRGAITSY